MATRRKKTFWLVNPAPKRNRRRARTATRNTSRRHPPKGFRTWKGYMASIRPTRNKGGTVAHRRRRRNPSRAVANPRRRRRNPSHRRRRNPGTTVVRYVPNPRRRRHHRNVTYAVNRRRRRYSRNPGFSARGIFSQITDAGMTAVQIVAGKAGARIIRGFIISDPNAAGSPKALGAEMLAGLGLAFAASKAFSRNVGRNLLAGAMVGVVESMVKRWKLPYISDALGDDGDPSVITVPAEMAGYVQQQIAPALAGYVNDASAEGLADDYGAGSGADAFDYAGT